MSIFDNQNNQNNSNGTNNGTNNGGGPLTFQGIPMDRRPGRVPLGRGLYEIQKAGKRKNTMNEDQFFAVLKCIEHEQTANVGRTYEFNTKLQGLYVKASLADIKQLIMFSYGAAVAKLPEAVVGATLDKECLADDWQRFTRDQTIEGKSFIGNKVRINALPGRTVDKEGKPLKDKRGNLLTPETAYPKYFFDPADA